MAITPSSFFFCITLLTYFFIILCEISKCFYGPKNATFFYSFSFLAGFSMSSTRDSFPLTSLFYFAIFSSPPLYSSSFSFTNIHYIMNSISESVQSFSFVLLFFMFLEFQREEIWWLFHQKPNSGLKGLTLNFLVSGKDKY